MKQKVVRKRDEPIRIQKKEKPSASTGKIETTGFVFEKENFRWLFIGLGFLVVGFLLMIGGRSDDPDFFNYGMFNFQRLTLSPILLMIGYVIGIYAIMKRPKKDPYNTQE
jgi:hypothetical protein